MQFILAPLISVLEFVAEILKDQNKMPEYAWFTGVINWFRSC